MPIIHIQDDSEEGRQREELINQVLPKEPITGNKTNEEILRMARPELIKMLMQEIEVYKAFPRNGEYKPKEFNPRNSKQCFMGQGFKHNGDGFEGWTDYDLARYRKAVGTIDHQTWGKATLLEIWAGDHFKQYPKMVKGVFLYCNGDRKTLPKITFYINPLFKNEASGEWDPHEEEVKTNEEGEWVTKIAHYVEIRDRMKKARVKNPLDLAVKAEDDPKPKTR